MPEVSPDRRQRPWGDPGMILGSSLGTGLCQGESGSGASLDASVAMSDRCFGTTQRGGVQRRLLCAERE
jgi:hypothetical protein